MGNITVQLPGGSYHILAGAGVLGAAAACAAQRPAGEAAVVVSDTQVWGLHGEAFSREMQQQGVVFSTVLLPPGEDSKSLAGLETLYSRFAEAGLGRGGLVVAFGGGVVGDLAGFAAATWMRGVDIVQVPTTLLAQVDSSVGGKTAINLPAGKNLAGAFHQPVLVVADTTLLSTLPAREFQCGMAEVVKYGALFSPALFGQLGAAPAPDALPGIIETCCGLKRDTVQADERDTGLRMLLNFGHTFGHAIEQLGGYQRHNHGEAVAIGMVLATAFGEQAGHTRRGCCHRLRATLQAQGLPTACPYMAEQLFKTMALDKKAREGGLDLILLRDIGQAEAVHFSMEHLHTLMTEVA